MSDMDTNGNGQISFEELQAGMQGGSGGNSQMKHLLMMADLPAGCSAKEIMHMLDDSGEGVLTYGELVGSFYRLIASGPFQQICLIMGGLNESKKLMKDNHKSTQDNHASTQQLIRQGRADTQKDLKRMRESLEQMKREFAASRVHAEKGCFESEESSWTPALVPASYVLDGCAESHVLDGDSDINDKMRVTPRNEVLPPRDVKSSVWEPVGQLVSRSAGMDGAFSSASNTTAGIVHSPARNGEHVRTLPGDVGGRILKQDKSRDGRIGPQFAAIVMPSMPAPQSTGMPEHGFPSEMLGSQCKVPQSSAAFNAAVCFGWSSPIKLAPEDVPDHGDVATRCESRRSPLPAEPSIPIEFQWEHSI